MEGTVLHPAFSWNGRPFTQLELIKTAREYLGSGTELEKGIAEFIIDWFNTEETLSLKTSGSTGIPKTIKVRKSAMVASAEATGSYFDLMAGTRALHCLPMGYIAGKMMMVRAMVLGWQLYTRSPQGAILSENDDDFDFSAMVPLQLGKNLNHLDKIKTLIVGGAPIPQELKRRLMPLATQVFETYGMTETVSHVAVKQVHPLPKRKGVAHFKALPGIRFGTDVRGCLIIHAPRITDAPLVTNDMVRLHAKDEFEWLGRADNIINSGGLKWNPEVIEKKLQSYISHPFFIAGIPDRVLGQRLVLVLEGVPMSMEELMALSIRAGMGKLERPKAIHIVPDFERTPTGKVKREATLQRYFNM